MTGFYDDPNPVETARRTATNDAAERLRAEMERAVDYQLIPARWIKWLDEALAVCADNDAAESEEWTPDRGRDAG